MAADWSELAPDLVGEIAKSICRIEDFIVFSSVCPSWRLCAVRENWVSDDRQLPWLLLAEPPEIKEAEEEEENRQWCRKFLNLNNNKRYDLPVPNLRGSKVYGSNHGWMLTFNLRFEMHLINPLSGLKLSLPHYTTFKHPRPLSCSPEFHLSPQWYRDYWIKKALVFKKKDQLFVAVIYGEFLYLAIAKPGDHSWTEVERDVDDEEASPWGEDVIFCNDQLFVIDNGGHLMLCQFEILKPNLIYLSSPPIDFDGSTTKSYLVESMSQLLFVARHVHTDCETHYYRTWGFGVYKFDFENNRWVGVDSLGDRALFVGDSSSMSLSSAMVSGCQSNSIYFTDDNFIGWHCIEEGYAGHDIGIYNLEKYACHGFPYRLDVSDRCSSFSCPLWVKPSLF